MMKRHAAWLMTTAFLAASSQIPAEAASSVKVSFEGQLVSFQGASPAVMNDRILVPIRGLFEKMGADVQWVETGQKAVATLHKNAETAEVMMRIGSPYMEISRTDQSGNLQQIIRKIDVPAQMANNRTMLPLRACAEAFGYAVSWNGEMGSADLHFSGSLRMPAGSYKEYSAVGDVSAMDDTDIDVFWLTNQTREENGKKPLALNALLSSLAKFRSQDMLENNYFDHTSPTYGPFWTQVLKAGYKSNGLGENAHRGVNNGAEGAIQGWMNSPKHRENMLNIYEEMGAGHAGGYYTAIYAIPEKE